MRKGYRIPTPIQRRCIPVIMDGRDVVGMARTGESAIVDVPHPTSYLTDAHRLRKDSSLSGASLRAT